MNEAPEPTFGIGDVVHVPKHGPVTVDWMNNHQFAGVLPSGERYGKTNIRLSEGHQLFGITEPWKIERKQ